MCIKAFSAEDHTLDETKGRGFEQKQFQVVISEQQHALYIIWPFPVSENIMKFTFATKNPSIL